MDDLASVWTAEQRIERKRQRNTRLRDFLIGGGRQSNGWEGEEAGRLWVLIRPGSGSKF